MLAARVAQVIDRARRAGRQVGRQVLVVQDAERVHPQAPPRVLAEPLLVGREVLDQRLPVGRPAHRVADRVDMSHDVGQADLRVEPMPELDQLGVDGRARIADDLDVPLAELAEAAGLRSVVAEHGADEGQAQRPGPDVHAVLDEGADDSGRRFWPQRPGRRLFLAALRAGDPEHLLLDRVAALAQAAGEELHALEERDLDPLEGVAAARGRGRQPRPGSTPASPRGAGRACRAAR